MFNQLVGASSSPLALPSDVQGVSKATVVRSEEDFPSATLRIINCHDTVVYALAPLQYCLVSACSDCVVVVGAVGRVIRIERCERVQVRRGAARRGGARSACAERDAPCPLPPGVAAAAAMTPTLGSICVTRTQLPSGLCHAVHVEAGTRQAGAFGQAFLACPLATMGCVP